MAVREAKPMTAADNVAWLADLIRAHRHRQGLSLADVAARAGMSASMLCYIERGRSCPTVQTAARVLEALGMELRVAVREEPKG